MYKLARVKLYDDPFKRSIHKGYIVVDDIFGKLFMSFHVREFINYVRWSLRGFKNVDKRFEFYFIYSQRTNMMYFVDRNMVTLSSFRCVDIDPFSPFGRFFYCFQDSKILFHGLKAVRFFLHASAAGKSPAALEEIYNAMLCFGQDLELDFNFDIEFDECIAPF